MVKCMKKLKVILSFFLICFIISIPFLFAEENDKPYVENIRTIEFSTFHSKKINEVFDGMKGMIIEIEIEIRNITKTYQVNTAMTDNLEKDLTEKVVKELEEDGLKELSSIASIKGFKINKVKLICTNADANIILERSKNV